MGFPSVSIQMDFSLLFDGLDLAERNSLIDLLTNAWLISGVASSLWQSRLPGPKPKVIVKVDAVCIATGLHVACISMTSTMKAKSKTKTARQPIFFVFFLHFFQWKNRTHPVCHIAQRMTRKQIIPRLSFRTNPLLINDEVIRALHLHALRCGGVWSANSNVINSPMSPNVCVTWPIPFDDERTNWFMGAEIVGPDQLIGHSSNFWKIDFGWITSRFVTVRTRWNLRNHWNHWEILSVSRRQPPNV